MTFFRDQAYFIVLAVPLDDIGVRARSITSIWLEKKPTRRVYPVRVVLL